MKTTATDILKVHAGLTPINLMLQRICHRATIQLATLPVTHPLVTPVHRCAPHNVKRYRSALHRLFHYFQIRPRRIETINPVCQAPNKLINFETKIPKRREDSQFNHNEDTVDILIYTDRSGEGGQAGTRAVLCRRDHVPKILHYYLGSLKWHMTYKAEVIGTLLGVTF